MFARKQDNLREQSDKRWLKHSYCLESYECRQSRYSDSADAGSRTS